MTKKSIWGTPVLVAVLASIASAAYTPGNLVVSRIGDGTTALSSAANPVALVEYDTTPGSVPVSTLSLNSGAIGNRLTMSGSATSEGALTLSDNGQYLTLAGYNATAGTLGIAGTASANVNRVAGRVDSLMNADLSTLYPANYSGNNIRSAVTADGSNIWTTGAGGTGGLVYSDFGGANQAQLNTLNTRVVNIFNGDLYVSSASGAFVGINIVSGGLPTSGSPTATLLPGTGVSGTGTPSPYDFWFSDANTLYVADDRSLASGGGLQKWTFNAGLNTWQLAYTLTGQLTAGLRGLAGTHDVTGAPILYAITADGTANDLVTVTDLGAASSFTTLQTAGPNTIFRGVDFAPVPEPLTITLLSAGTMLLVGRRGRRLSR